jgi:hypothetical protein
MAKSSMNPKKKIPSFCFESPWLKPFDLDLYSTVVVAGARTLRATWSPELAQDLQGFHGLDIEEELTRVLSEEISRQINRDIMTTLTQDLVPVQPLDAPVGHLFYFDFQYEDTKEPKVYSDGSWSLGNVFEGSIGIKIEIKKFEFI